MPNPLRSVTARVTDGIQRLRGEGDKPVSHVDDDPNAEPLPPPPTVEAADQELADLDESAAPPIEIPEEKGIVELFAEVDPIPPLPLTAPHEMGLAVVVVGLAQAISDVGLLRDRRVRRVLDLVGDRLSVTVGPDGITVRGLLRSRHTPWKRIQQLTFTSRYDQWRGKLVTDLADDVSGRMIPFPVPGLKWLLGRIVDGIASVVEDRVFTAEELEKLRVRLGHSLTDIERRGLDIELAGPLRVLMFLSFGLSEAVKAEAANRGVKVVGTT